MTGDCYLILWDSLFIETLANQNIKLLRPASSLLIHYLPSQNPRLAPVEKSYLQAKEDEVIAEIEHLVATGRRIRKFLIERFPEKRVSLSEPGVDPLFWANRKNQPEASINPRIGLLTVANLLPAKGYRDLLELLSKLLDKKCHWHIVGDDRCDRKFTDEFWLTAKRLNVSAHITCHGVLTPHALCEVMAHADIFISASHFEAYGMALAEAVATGLPAVATQVGEAHRLVRHTQSGYLVPVGAWDSMADYVNQLIDSYPLRDRFRKNALTRKPRTWEQTFEEFRAACQSWCDQ